ncbi:hypothetical protein C464_16132 [Halorubrum coriense DSM 10284]|uniref:Uncharacterized protein n=1 Tax=Halorubrum coriense DSM 10284 TaxID=1227466 RepID=M0EB93_9EURY|nr:hypothetical protein [Halorubrum coriense]ELZ43694.1 hypothetical protein C464_16132 [Halorubrum coriense DSM 10284]
MTPKLDDRGQLMLVGAVVMAASLLALVVVLNSTIYTQNTNPGDTLDETREVGQQLEVVQTDVVRLTDRLAQPGRHVDVYELNATLKAYGDTRAEQTVSRRPAYLDIALNESASTLRREVLRQGNRSRDIVSNTTESDWTLVENATFNESTPFVVTVEPQSSTSPTAFIVEGDSGGRWYLNVSRGSPGVDIAVTYDNGTTTTTTVSGNATRLNVTGGAVDGTQSFAFAPGLTAPYDLHVNDGHQSNGTYSIVVDEVSGVNTGNFHPDPTNGQPYVSREVTTVVVDVNYVSDKVSTESQITVPLGDGSG